MLTDLDILSKDLVGNLKSDKDFVSCRLKDPERHKRSQRFITWLADTLLMRKALFDHLTSRGIQVYVWVLNDEEDFKRAFDLGATGIMTDFPTKLKEFMEKNNYTK